MDAIQRSDEAGIKRAQQEAQTSAQQHETPEMAALLDALDDLIDFVAEDAITAGSSMPGGRGCYGPDIAGTDRRYAAVLDAVRKLIKPVVPQQEPKPTAPSNLHRVWDWMSRGAF